MRIAAICLLTSSFLASAQSDGPPPEFLRAYRLAEERKYVEAVRILEGELAKGESRRNALYSLGMIALAGELFDRAKTALEELRDLEPDAGNVRMALVRVYQATGDRAARERERETLFALRKTKKDVALVGAQQYLRDQFHIGERVVQVVEHFELSGDRAKRYEFWVLGKNAQEPEYKFSLGSYAATNAVWRQSQKRKGSERVFHLDGYFPNQHVLYGMHHPEPDYDRVREMVEKIIREKDGTGSAK